MTAVVLDANQQPLPGVSVSFSKTAGALRAVAATTDGGGNARTVLTTATSATVTATAGDGVQATTSVAVDPATEIAITAAPTTPVVGQAIAFTVTLRNERHAIRNAAIDFGDGESQVLGATRRAVVVHTYDEAGVYTVTVEATDVAGRTVSASTVVRVDRAPAISVTVAVSPSSPVVGQPVTFTVTVTPPANGPAVDEAVIDFDDGDKESLGAMTGSRTVAHVYKRAGSYVVTVTAQDTAGRRSAASVGLIISDE